MVIDDVAGFFLAWPRVLAQSPTDDVVTPGVEVPLLALMVSILGFVALVAIVVTAIFSQASQSISRRRRVPRVERPVPVTVAAPTVVQPVYKKAPFSIQFPQIPAGFPDVWGVGETIEIVLRAEDRALVRLAQIPGLTVRIGDDEVTPAFSRGLARFRRVFNERGPYEIVILLKVRGESNPRRLARTLRIVDYREEMAEIFHNFKNEVTATMVHVPEDATPWEVYDLVLSANPDVPEAIVRDIVRGFEEAKFSNHAVDRGSYSKMIEALLKLERAGV